jgi:translocation and assembly module TamB
VTLPASSERSLTVSGSARDTSGRNHRLAADIENVADEWRARAREFVIALPDGSWMLSAPAQLTYRQSEFVIDRISLRNGRAEISAAGQFSMQNDQALTIQLKGIDLATLRHWRPEVADIKGMLTAQAQVRGTAAQPEIEASAAVVDGNIAGQNYRSANARAEYRRQQLSLDVVLAQDERHDLSVHGTAPLALAWHPIWRAEPLPGMALHAHSDGLSLGFLNALKAPAENIAGELALDLALTGSLADPQARGNFELSNGAFAVKRLGLRVNDVNFSANADSRRLIVKQLRARSGSGTISGNGVLSLQRYLPEDMNLTIAARRWPAIANERYQAIINADLRASGAIAAPVVAGSVEVIEGTLRPTLAALEKTSVAVERDPTIVVVHQRGSAPIASPTKAENASDNALWKGMALDLKITIPKNLWIRHPNANVELSGNLNLVKKSSTDPAITGLIEAVRGWVGFQGRRFEMTRGLVRFTGSQPINPSFDMVGEYRVDDYEISVIVGGTAEKPTLTLRSDPTLEQSDILAVLLFGKPTAELSGNQQLSLRQNAIDIGAGFAAAELTKTVTDALGLERLGLDLSELSYSGGQVRVGQYLGQQTFVSFGQEVSGKHSQEVSVEYQITRSVRIDATRDATGNNGVDIIWRKRY